MGLLLQLLSVYSSGVVLSNDLLIKEKLISTNHARQFRSTLTEDFDRKLGQIIWKKVFIFVYYFFS